MLHYKQNIILLDEIDSTNNYLKQKAEEEDLNEGTVVFTRNQLAGKGQTGNIWLSEKDKNILESLYMKPEFLPAEYMFMISKIVSIAIIEVFNAIEKGFCIKWPNDIYFDNKKIGGILVENKLMGSQISQSIIGIGLNINQTVFENTLPNPISLQNICNTSFDLHAVNENIIHQIFKWYEILSDGDVTRIDKAYHNQLFRKIGLHRYKDDDGTFEAKIQKVNSDGQLVLQTEDGNNKTFYFKEVEFIL